MTDKLSEHCTEFYFPKGADCDPCKNRDEKIKILKQQLNKAQKSILTLNKKLFDSQQTAESAKKDAEIYYNWFHYELEEKKKLEEFIQNKLANLKLETKELGASITEIKKTKDPKG